jgi:hypothetical protein
MSSLRGALFAMIVVGCSENQLSSITEPAAVPPDPDAPVADAGPDAQVNPGDGATLDGSGSSDPNGLVPLVYAWTLVSYPQGSSAQVDGLDTVHPTLNTDLAGDYTLELTVQNTNLLWDENPDLVVITEVATGFD